MLRLLLVVALAAPACAQTDKPDAVAVDDARQRRADSVITRTDGCCADSLATAEVPVDLGDGTVTVRVWTAPITDRIGSPGLERYPLNALNLHDDESTSVEAALQVLRQRGGRVVELAHTGDRTVTFATGGRTYEADPNRMFTPLGRERTLDRFSEATPEAEAALEAFADSVLAVYAAEPPAVVVTLHNNTEANYSARSYEPGAEYAADAAAVTVHDGTDPDDFFFVTDRVLYDLLVGRGFNAVLQDNAAATDDGSLSVWAAREGVPYVNVEAQHGHTVEQARMIEALVDVLSDRPE